MDDEKFIQGAVKHPGSLRRFAKKHHTLDKSGNIDLQKTRKVALKEKEPGRSHRLRQINLARTLRKLRR